MPANLEEISAPRAEAGAARARRHLARDGRGALQALPGLRRTSGTRSSTKLDERRPRRREPGLLGGARAQGRPHVRDRRDQEPRDLLRPPRRHGRRPGRRRRRADRARLRLGRRLARRPQGDRDGRPRLGLDRLRLGRAPALQLHRRRPEHVPVWNATPLVALDVYEHAYFLDYQTDRAAYIDAFLAQPGLGRRERRGSRRTGSPRHRHRGLRPRSATWPGRCPSGTGSCGRQAASTSARSAAATSARRTSGARTGASYGLAGHRARHREGLRAGVPRDPVRRARSPACSRARRRCSATRGRSSSASRRAARWSRRAAARSSASRRSSALIGLGVWIAVFLADPLRVGRVDRRRGRRWSSSRSPSASRGR